VARSRRRGAPPLLILDSGAVIALSRREPRARAFLQRALELEAWVEVPVVVVAETTRGTRRDAAVNRILKAVDAVPATHEVVGRTAGALLGRSTDAGVVDALVVAQAVEAGGGVILTSDPRDLASLAAGHSEVQIQVT
jgi:predicted nucleic acid-binding protein